MKEYASNPATRTGGNGGVILNVARITYKCLLLVVARCIIYIHILLVVAANKAQGVNLRGMATN